jgi:serine/arginine repetitive matrix protein 2
MTERTFRSPSPHGAGANGQRQQPPVPQIPANYNNIPPLPVKSHRRTTSLEPPPPRVLSPPLTRPAGRGVSLDRGANVPPPKAKARVSSLQNINELERTDSNSSQNFSYPNRARPLSPTARRPASPTINQQTIVLAAQRASGAAAAAAEYMQYDVTRASEQPVKKKKKKVVRGSAEGSHLQQGGMGGPPIVTPLAPGPAPASQPTTNGESQTAPVKKKKKAAVAATGEGSHLPGARPMSPTYSSDSDSTPEKSQRRVQRASGQLNKQPSVVREDWEGEQDGSTSLASPAHQREEEGLSPINSPATLQGKKASTAANVSRKIDEAAMPPKAENSPVYNAVTMPQAADKQHLVVAENGAPVSRTTSLSPSRSMRFSDRLSTDLTAGKRHEPLPRSVSPAKSALKHHSPSPTDPRFPGRYIHSQTASEASDNTSNLSADGVGPYKKKKSARVSFDAEPEIVGTAAAADQTGTPILASPQDKAPGKKGWFGLSKGKTTPALGTIAAEDELEEIMKPRPALPAFGSVRRSGRGNEAGEAASSYHSVSMTGAMAPTSSAMSSASSETSSGSQIPTLDTSVSSDHAIGSLIAQDAAKKQIHDPRLPIPPEVTSVEGTGYQSDTESEDDKENQTQSRTDTHKEAVVQSSASTAAPALMTASMPLEKVPTVTLQPPTPGLEQRQPDEWLVTVPGGFPIATEALGNTPTPKPESSKELGSTTPTGLGIAEPVPSETVSVASPNEALLESLRRQPLDNEDNESSAGDSIYSDAAEEASEHGDGFGSINAIVESPVIATKEPAKTITTPPESPLTRNFNQARPEGNARTASWDQAQNHWSGIAQAYRQVVQPQQAEQQQVSEMPVVQTYADKKPSMKKKKVTARPKETLVPDSPPQRTLPQSSPYPRVAPTDVPAPPPFRHSMRAQEEFEQQHFRSSMRQRPQSSQQPIARPASPPMQQQGPPPKKSKGTLQKRNIPPAIATPVAVTMAARAAATERPRAQAGPPAQIKNLQRTMSNDSDSESSFKKRHRRGASLQGSTMRRSMRAPPPEPEPTKPGGRRGIRSMSPPVDRRPMSPGFAHKTMRTSMRQSTESQAPTMRPQPQQRRSSSLFGRRNKDKSPPHAAPLPLTKKITSRFGDSDEEDDARPRVFKSRFEDSSDDEASPVKYRPVRGIPRKADDGDSTDLEDSDDEQKTASKAKAQALAVNTAQANGAGGVTEMPSSPTSSTAKKGGFFSRFRSKKGKDPSSKSRLGGTIAERNARLEHNQPAMDATEEENISSTRKIQREDKKQASRLGFSSIEERDRVLEETRMKLEEARDQPNNIPRPVLSTQGRETPTRIMSDSWPLPPKMPAIEEDRPNTSDGVDLPYSQFDSNLRQSLGEQAPTTDTLQSAGGPPIYGRTGKKKRFPMLRRAFGLQD